jgi:hypothetical protein
MKIDMTNIAYTAEYLDKRTRLEAAFIPENRKGLESAVLTDGFRLDKQYYDAGSADAFEGLLFDGDNRLVFRYKSLDDSGDSVPRVITHADGHSYFIFRTDLYGYGIYDMTDKKEFRHIPKATETFIWTEVAYNPKNDILLVDGCYWACPYGVILLDFKNPLRETKWVDVFWELDPGSSRYDDIAFIRWGDNNELVLKALYGQPVKQEEIAIPQEEYGKWLAHADRNGEDSYRKQG